MIGFLLKPSWVGFAELECHEESSSPTLVADRHPSTSMIISSTMARAITIIMMATMATSSDPRGCHLQMICAAARKGVAMELLEPLRGLRELRRAFMLGEISSAVVLHSYLNCFLHISSICPLLFPGAAVSAHGHGARTRALILPIRLHFIPLLLQSASLETQKRSKNP